MTISQPSATRFAAPSGERRRLLFLLAFPPRLDATHGGARASAHILSMLAARHDVAVVYLRRRDEPPIDASLRERCGLVEEVMRDTASGLLPRLRHRLRAALLQARGVPWWPADIGAANFASRAREAALAWRPDVVHLDFFVMGQFGDALGPVTAPRVLTPYEPFSAAAAERAAASRGVARVRASMDAARWRRYERATMERADAVIAFTERDERAFAALAGSTRVHRIPLGIPIPAHALDARGVAPAEVLFVGNFTHPPNADAALRLVRGIAPLLHERAPDARIVIVGPEPSAALRAESGERVIVTGEVDDVTPYLERAAVVVAPLRLGGGMRVKVLEALAAGKAVVATPRAVEGLDVADGAQVRIADDDAGIALAIADLLADPDTRIALGARARAWAQDTFSEERWAASYDALYRALGRTHRSSGRVATSRTASEEDDIMRSADWRFLLPRPASGRFDRLVVRGATAALLDGVRTLHLADEVTGMLPNDGSASAVVVLPGEPVVPRVLARALGGHGSLYIEVDRLSSPNLRWTPQRLTRELEACGLAVTGVYVVGRRGVAPRRYMPVDEAGPALWFLSSAYRPVTAAQRLAAWLARDLLRAGAHRRVLLPLLPRFAITAVMRGTRETPLALDAAPDGGVAPGARVMLFGDGADRVVVLPFAPGARQPAIALKIPRSAPFRGRTENEQRRMAELRATLPPDLARAIPAPRGIVSDGDRFAASEDALAGRTLLASSGSRGASVRRRIADLRLACDWIAEFHLATMVERRAWSSREADEWIDALFAKFVATYGDRPAERRLRAMALAHARSIVGATVPVVWQHRDYAVWNLARSADGLSVLDWEGARIGPPLCDLLYLATTWDIAIRRPARLDEEIANFGALFLRPPGDDAYRLAARDAIRRYLARLDLDVRLVPLLLLHHRLELAARRADQLDDRGVAPSDRRAGDLWVAAVEHLAEHADALFHAWQ